MLHRLIVICHEDEKLMAYSFMDNLDVPIKMRIIKDIRTLHDIKQTFSVFSVTSDFLVYLMTDKSRDRMLQGLSQNRDTIQARGLVVIPVLMGSFNVPFNFFSAQPVIASTGDMEDFVGKVTQVIKNYLSIDFGRITPMNFENLVRDVLKAYHFEGVKLTYSDHVDFGYDMMCTFKNEKSETEKWLVEIKYALESRFTIRSIDLIIQQDREHYLADHKLMLVTNGLFTSVVGAYIGDITKEKEISIYVVDGWKLRNLIAYHIDLVKKYFPYE